MTLIVGEQETHFLNFMEYKNIYYYTKSKCYLRVFGLLLSVGSLLTNIQFQKTNLKPSVAEKDFKFLDARRKKALIYCKSIYIGLEVDFVQRSEN